ncbi:CD320 antigen [Symphalangus syndactylus]|uniref:CD320 antigen n=1 Tax=Symphalangus syndactylus TaxID=9590 RepID=UPI002442437E|nr:CD320 antigen [Symphalangus syndactylus]
MLGLWDENEFAPEGRQLVPGETEICKGRVSKSGCRSYPVTLRRRVSWLPQGTVLGPSAAKKDQLWTKRVLRPPCPLEGERPQLQAAAAGAAELRGLGPAPTPRVRVSRYKRAVWTARGRRRCGDSSTGGWMARVGARRTGALGLALLLLLGLGLGLEAAASPLSTPTSARAAGPSSGSCPPTKFQCRTSGLCVPLTWRCDRDLDCSDGSDEEECRIEPCTQNGQCPPPSGLPCPCTGVSDCSGGTDKKLRNCSRLACPAGELRCTLSDDCIPLTWRCDGHPDCPDSSDELGCGTNEILPEGDATTMGSPVTLESVTSLGNATTMGPPVTLESVTSLWNATIMGPPVTLESVTSVGNATSSSAGDQSGSPAAYGVIAAAAVLSTSLVAATLLLLSWLRAQERLRPLGLLVAMKESLLLSEQKTSLP